MASHTASSLLQVTDIKSELHAHTVASDGMLTIDRLITEARDRGLRAIAITDHSQSSPEADGLSPDDLRRHMDAVRQAGSRIGGITVLAGSEVDILEDGSLDYDDDLLSELDMVVASVHHHLEQPPEIATQRLVRAVRHPLVHVLGHATARERGYVPGLTPDIHVLARAAAAHGTALEINCNPIRLDLCAEHVRIALEAGALISVNCDVHKEAHFDRLELGIEVARAAGVPAERCINAWEPARLMRWLAQRSRPWQ